LLKVYSVLLDVYAQALREPKPPPPPGWSAP
jgi:hypothetical protein